MLFIETDIFTEDVKTLLDDDEYHRFQIFLATQPEYGDVIFFHRTRECEIRLLLIYRKGIKDDLSAGEKAILKKMIERW
jgi:hypothetical protein